MDVAMHLMDILWPEVLMLVMVIRVSVALLLRVVDWFCTAILFMDDWLFTSRF